MKRRSPTPVMLSKIRPLVCSSLAPCLYLAVVLAVSATAVAQEIQSHGGDDLDYVFGDFNDPGATRGFVQSLRPNLLEPIHLDCPLTNTRYLQDLDSETYSLRERATNCLTLNLDAKTAAEIDRSLAGNTITLEKRARLEGIQRRANGRRARCVVEGELHFAPFVVITEEQLHQNLDVCAPRGLQESNELAAWVQTFSGAPQRAFEAFRLLYRDFGANFDFRTAVHWSDCSPIGNDGEVLGLFRLAADPYADFCNLYTSQLFESNLNPQAISFTCVTTPKDSPDGAAVNVYKVQASSIAADRTWCKDETLVYRSIPISLCQRLAAVEGEQLRMESNIRQSFPHAACMQALPSLSGSVGLEIAAEYHQQSRHTLGSIRVDFRFPRNSGLMEGTEVGTVNIYAVDMPFRQLDFTEGGGQKPDLIELIDSEFARVSNIASEVPYQFEFWLEAEHQQAFKTRLIQSNVPVKILTEGPRFRFEFQMTDEPVDIVLEVYKETSEPQLNPEGPIVMAPLEEEPRF